LITAIASDLFPGQALGAVNGAVGSAFGLGAAVFPWLAGTLFDRSGSYLLPFSIAAAAVLLSTISLWFTPRLKTYPQ
jgi:MFS family permease